MHNCYFVILIFVVLISLYGNNLTAVKLNNTVLLINENMIEECISEKSLIDSYDYGIEVLELNVDETINVVTTTIKENLSSFDPVVGFYFYDSIKSLPCSVNGCKCNSVQISVTIFYQGKEFNRTKCYELIEKKK